MYEPVDVLLCVGYQYVDDLLPKMWAYGQPKAVISLATHPTMEIHAKFRPDVECVGAIPDSLHALSAEGVHRKEGRPMSQIKRVYREIVDAQTEHGGRLTPIQVIDVVNRHLDDGILCTDIGYYRHHAILFSAPRAVGRFFTDAGLSSFGSGLPGAIAAQLERPQSPVFLVCGDGGFHSGSGDLETLARYRLPVVVIVMNNSAFELIHLYQRRHNKDPNPKVVKLGTVDFVKLAEANGCRGVLARSRVELEQAVRAHDRSGPLVIEVPMEYRDREGFRESF
jgi:thiamine pyrophosphate-dependent acetolactate synthase large subunit-like protein